MQKLEAKTKATCVHGFRTHSPSSSSSSSSTWHWCGWLVVFVVGWRFIVPMAPALMWSGWLLIWFGRGGELIAISLVFSRSECGATMTHRYVPAMNNHQCFVIFYLLHLKVRLVFKSLKRVHCCWSVCLNSQPHMHSCRSIFLLTLCAGVYVNTYPTL